MEWMMRRMIVDLIKTDPSGNGGNLHQTTPQLAVGPGIGVWSPAPAGDAGAAQTGAHSGKRPIDTLTSGCASFGTRMPDDVLYHFQASRDYNPTPKLETIPRPRFSRSTQPTTSANRPSWASMESREIKRVKGTAAMSSDPHQRREMWPRDHGNRQVGKQYLVEFMQPPVQASEIISA